MAARHVILAAVVLALLVWRWPQDERVPPVVIREAEPQDWNWDGYDRPGGPTVPPDIFVLSWQPNEKLRSRRVHEAEIFLTSEGVVWMFEFSGLRASEAWARVYSAAQAEALYDAIASELERLHWSSRWARRIDVALERWTAAGRSVVLYNVPWSGGLERLAAGLERTGVSYSDLYGHTFQASRDPIPEFGTVYPRLATHPWVYRRLNRQPRAKAALPSILPSDLPARIGDSHEQLRKVLTREGRDTPLLAPELRN